MEPPLITAVHNSSSTSLLVTWEARQNESILGYVILYSGNVSIDAWRNLTVNSSVTTAELTELHKYTNYCIRILVFTQKRQGKAGNCTHARTDEDGELIQHSMSDCSKVVSLML